MAGTRRIVPRGDLEGSIGSGEKRWAKAYIGNVSVTYDTVADMVADLELRKDTSARTKGFANVNDNGAAFYNIREKTVSDVDDGGSIIFLDNGDVAELITDGTANVKQFGAVGDNTHDDTAAFQKAIDSGFDVFIPTSNGEKYKITSTLTVANPRCKRIYGEEYGKFRNHGGIFYTNTDADAPLFDIQIEGCNILNLTFNGADMEGTFMNAHRTWDGNAYADVDVRIQDCRIMSFRYGFKFIGRGLEVINNSFANIRFLALLNWVDAEESLNTHPAQFGQRAIRFVGNRMHMIYTQGVYVQSGHAYGFQFIDNLIDNGRMVDHLIRCENEAWNWLISGNTVNGLQSTTVFNFQSGIKNSIISNNVITADPLYWSGSSNIIGMFMNLIGCNGLTIQDNAVDYITNNLISCSGTIKGLNVSGNNFSNVGGNGIAFDSISSTGNIAVCGNNFEFSSDQNSHYILYSTNSATKTINNSFCHDNTGNATDILNLVIIEEPLLNSWGIHLIPTGTDLNTLTQSGRYAPQNSSAASTLVNCPVSAGFILEVNRRFGSYVGTQTIYSGSRIYCRSYSSSGWGNWFQYTGAQV